MVFALASVRRDRASENTVRLQLGNFGLWGLFAPQRQASVYLREAAQPKLMYKGFIVSVCLQTLPGRMVFAWRLRRDRASENTVVAGTLAFGDCLRPNDRLRSTCREAAQRSRKRRPFIVSVCLQTLPGRPDGVRFGVGTSG